MIALIQRVAEAGVAVGGESVGAIGPGILALVGVERDDSEAQAERLAERVLGYRIFPDAQGRMNVSLVDTGGALLAVPQFTLVADTRKGTRPSFSSGASPEEGKRSSNASSRPRAGRRAWRPAASAPKCSVSLVNDGPVTFWLQVRPGS